MSVDPPALVPAAPAALDDLAVLLARAERASPSGAARLQVVAAAGVLVASVAPLATGAAEDASLPVVVGIRVLALAGPPAPVVGDLDATVPLRALLDRLARTRTHLPLPPERVLGASWSALSPPRDGWRAVASPSASDLAVAAAAGARHVAAGQPRGAVWSRPLPAAGEVPAGAALAADVLGFLGAAPGAPAGLDAPGALVARSGPWWRLTTPAGHVLARRPALLG